MCKRKWRTHTVSSVKRTSTECCCIRYIKTLYLDLDLAHVSIPVGKGLLAGKVADLAILRSQCGKDPSPTVVASG